MSFTIDDRWTAAEGLAAWLDAGGPGAGFAVFVRALGDPDPAVDAVLRGRAADPVWEDFEDWHVQLLSRDESRAVPPARWTLLPWVDASLLYAGNVGPVAAADRAVFASWLRSRHGWASEGWAGDWLARGDVFAPDEVVAVVEDDLVQCPRSGKGPLVHALLVAAAAPGPHRQDAFAVARSLAEALEPTALPDLLAGLPEATVEALATDELLGDALEHGGDEELLRALVSVLAARRAPHGVRRCLELVGRMEEAGYGWGAELIRRLHETHGRVARDAFRAVRADRSLPFERGTPAAAAIELILEEEGRGDHPVRCTLVGTARVFRPGAVRLDRQLPVFVGGDRVGTAVAEELPAWAVTEVRFTAELDPDRVPAEWQGAQVPFRDVTRHHRWWNLPPSPDGYPCPPPLGIQLDRHAAPLFDAFPPSLTPVPPHSPAPPCAADHAATPPLTSLPRVSLRVSHPRCAGCAYEAGFLAGRRRAEVLPSIDGLPSDRAGRKARDALAAWAEGYLAGVLRSRGR
jgi:hypothetical protein